MFVDIISFLPFAACFFWIIFISLMIPKSKTYFALLSLLVALLLSLFTDNCYYAPSSSIKILTFASNLSQFAMPCLIPLLMLYLRVMRVGKHPTVARLSWLLVPVVLFTAAELLSFTAGRSEVERFFSELYSGAFSLRESNPSIDIRYYYIFAVILFRVAIVIEVIGLIGTHIAMMRVEGFHPRNLIGFLRDGKSIHIVELQFLNLLPLLGLYMVKLFFFRSNLVQHPGLEILLSVLTALSITPFCYVALFSEKKWVTLEDLKRGFRYNYKPETKEAFIGSMIQILLAEGGESVKVHVEHKLSQQMEAQEESESPVPWPARHLYEKMMENRDDESLVGRFERLMTQERLFLQPGLTLMDVAEKLNTNKTYISKLVNQTYNIPFPDLVNTLRIDYAEEYLISHRDATQMDIARACGFPSASSLNNTFKKVTGMTPRIWLATYDQHHN